MTKCSDVMTGEVDCCTPDTTVDQVAKLMKILNVGPIPIIETTKSRKLVGLVTDRDLVIRVLADGKEPQKVKVGEIMTTKPIVCSPDSKIDDALRLMERHQVRRIFIVDDSNQLIGIISEADIATRLRKPNKTAEFVEAVCNSKLPVH